MSESHPISDHTFIAPRAFDAMFHSATHVEQIIIEHRSKVNGESAVFTVINGEQFRDRSIQDLLLRKHDSVSLTITHHINIVWNDVCLASELVEVFVSNHASSSVSIKLKLTVNGQVFETETCISFTEAMFELNELIGPNVSWWLQTCWDCKCSYEAFLWPTDDREELRCFRDVPDAFSEIQQKHKFASSAALYAGDYFVHAFHKCAAWRSRI